MPYLLSVLLIVSLVLLLLAVLGPVAHGKNDRGALYRSRSLMTENEREFFVGVWAWPVESAGPFSKAMQPWGAISHSPG